MSNETNIRDLFAAIDNQDTDKFLTYLSEDASFTFGNNPVVKGRKAVGEAVEGFFSSIAGLGHTVQHVWEVPGHIICRGEAEYLRLDDKTVTIPFVNVFGMAGDLVQEYQIYIDISPLYAE